MSSAGAACTDEGEELGLHGRLSHLPATGVSTSTRWAGTECIFLLEGTMRDSTPFGENLVLHRTIETFLGRSVIAVKDVVRNEGATRAPLMILYHCNLGWPLVDDGAVLMMNARSSTPRDSDAAPGLDAARQFHAPLAGYREQVFYHDLEADDDGLATTLIANRLLNLGLYIRFRQKELPRCVEWKMMGEGTYVVGIEPANCLVEGRNRERIAGTLQFLEPGEQREFLLHIGVLEGKGEVEDFAGKHRLRA
jgi:hypothetical protein